MFAVVQPVVRPPRSFLGRLFFRKSPSPKAIVSQCADIQYILIEAPIVKGAINWDAVGRLAGADATSLLLPEGLRPPESSGIRRYVPDSFKRQILFNTACQLLERSSIPARDRKVCLYDPCAKHPEFARRLLEMAGNVQILTDSKDAYASLSEEAYNELGAQFIFSSKSPAECSFDLLFAPCGLDDPPPFPKSPCICIGDIFTRFSLPGNGIRLPDTYQKNLPTGISACDFAAILWEREHLNFFRHLTASSLLQGGSIVPSCNILLQKSA